MGYTTSFEGSFTFSVPLTAAQVAYINQFSATRRMKRNPFIAATLPDPLREAVSLPVGDSGGYFVGGGGYAGQDDDKGVVDHNTPPFGQPGLWCQWVASADGTKLHWDEGEKFKRYVAWLEYLIEHFFTPWGTALNGEVKWWGEDNEDMGVIVAMNSEITTLKAKIEFVEEDD